jgi:hypothetical protein
MRGQDIIDILEYAAYQTQNLWLLRSSSSAVHRYGRGGGRSPPTVLYQGITTRIDR